MKPLRTAPARLVGLMGVTLMLLTGCASSIERAKINQSERDTHQELQGEIINAPAPALRLSGSVTSDDRDRVSLCKRELNSLQKINPAIYSAKKASFDGLVRNASIYTSVRGDVDVQTKSTMDALYKYKTNQVCDQIKRAVMTGLIRRGESVR